MGNDLPAPVPRRPGALRTIATLYVVAAAVLVFWPSRVTDLFGGWLDAADHTYRYASQLLEIAANILLFVPAGWLASLLLPRGKRWLAILGGTAVSVAIELTQAAFLPQRVASPTDVLANSLGTALGVALAAVFGGLRSRRARRDPKPRP